MKPLRHNIAILSFGFTLMALAGCAHKKPVLVAPQQIPTAAAPEATPTPEQPAAQPSDNAQAQQDAQTPQDAQAQPTPQDQTKTGTAQTDKSKPKKPSPRKTGDKAVEVAKNGTRKTIVRADKTDPNPPSGPIVPATSADAAHNQAATDQLLKNAQANLNAINRQLSKKEEGERSQVLEFISQSQKATNENDPSRAYNLALKASLLSDELVKQR
ncbi:MAG TPA: hypothetical protein VFB76_12155 [Candidatus Angelobacter sp.]|nr:hypothetical protein [Candidatus Angelobacter sp.]